MTLEKAIAETEKGKDEEQGPCNCASSFITYNIFIKTFYCSN